MKNPLRWDHLSWPRIEEAAKRDAIILMPIGSIEQHGPHLPVGCDYMLAQIMCERIAAELDKRGQPVLVAPSFMAANSVHHMRFPGTITLKPSTFIQVLTEQLECIAAHGFRKIVLVNGHGGNTAPIGAALVTINSALGFPVYTCGYWAGCDAIQAEVLETQSGMIHACESETSMMLALWEALVEPCYTTTSGPMGHPTGAEDAGLVSTFRRMEEMTENGVMGNSYKATKAKGERMAEAMTQAVADTITSGLWPTK